MKTISSRIRIGGTIGAVLLLLGLAGAIYQSVASQIDLAQHPPPGQLIDVGGYRLHFYCTGQGSPTVILFHGLGGNVYHWALIQAELETFTQVCSYDRAGYGWSDPGPRPRSPLQNARELHMLLSQAGLSGQLILVGHSWGTNGAQVFADQYPTNIVGVVLVDGGFAKEAAKLCPEVPCLPTTARVGTDVFVALQPTLFRLGILRLMGFPQPYADNLRYLSPGQTSAFLAGYGQTKSADTSSAEWQDWDMQVGHVGEAGSLGNLPVRAFMAESSLPDWAYAGASDPSHQFDKRLMSELQTLSSDAEVLVVPGADHASPLFNPEHRQYIVAAVREIVAKGRNP